MGSGAELVDSTAGALAYVRKRTQILIVHHPVTHEFCRRVNIPPTFSRRWWVLQRTCLLMLANGLDAQHPPFLYLTNVVDMSTFCPHSPCVIRPSGIRQKLSDPVTYRQHSRRILNDYIDPLGCLRHSREIGLLSLGETH